MLKGFSCSFDVRHKGHKAKFIGFINLFLQDPVLRIPDVNTGSWIRIFFFHPGPDPHHRVKVFLTEKIVQIFRKYDPGCSSRIRIRILPIPDP
jgi:hypothetical protein